jgi:hypothetical protein
LRYDLCETCKALAAEIAALYEHPLKEEEQA